MNSLEPRLLDVRIGVKLFAGINHCEMKKVLSSRRRKKFGFKETAVEVEELDGGLYNVRFEYLY